jgi:hypothetical protein
MSDAAAAAASLIAGQATASITTPEGELPEDAAPVVFDRLSVERRALCAISDELYSDRLGPRNSLPAIADFLINDPNTTNPPPPNARLEVAGLPLADQVQLVLDNLDRLIEAGLATREGDVNDPTHTYHVTEAGVLEMQN